jgi:hypothetical protein
MGARFIREIETGWPGWNLHEFDLDLDNASSHMHDPGR